jgi:hypothetical protein
VVGLSPRQKEKARSPPSGVFSLGNGFLAVTTKVRRLIFLQGGRKVCKPHDETSFAKPASGGEPGCFPLPVPIYPRPRRKTFCETIYEPRPFFCNPRALCRLASCLVWLRRLLRPWAGAPYGMAVLRAVACLRVRLTCMLRGRHTYKSGHCPGQVTANGRTATRRGVSSWSAISCGRRPPWPSRKIRKTSGV